MRRGFSLIELMLVISILSILAGLAMPRYMHAVLKARKSEATSMMQGIATAQVTYELVNSSYVTGRSNPGLAIGKNLRAFNPSMTGWVDLGFFPDGEVRCNYATGQYGSEPVWARVDAMCDVDDDNSTATIRYYVATEEEVGYFYDLYPDRF